MDLYSPDSIVAVAIVLPLLAAVAVFLRFLVRLKIQPTYLGLDDWMVAVGLVFALADGANLCVGAILGILGRSWEGQVPVERQAVEAKSDYAQLILEKPLYAMMKLSVLFFYRRIFSSEQRFMRFNSFMIGLIIVWSLAYLIAEIFQCGLEPWQLWTGGDTDACVNRTWLNFSYAVTDVIGDVLVVSMPFPIIRHLFMDRRQKAGVAVIFLLGALSTAAAVVRLGFIAVAAAQDYGALGVNLHEATTPPSVWSTVEGSIGLLAACLPPLGPLLRRVPKARKASMQAYRRYRTRRNYEKSASSSIPGASEPGISLSPSSVPGSVTYDSWGAPIRDNRQQQLSQFSWPGHGRGQSPGRGPGHSHKESQQLSMTSSLHNHVRGDWGSPPV